MVSVGVGGAEFAKLVQLSGLLLVALVLAGTFGVSGSWKLADQRRAAIAVLDYQLVDERFAPAIAFVLGVLELSTAFAVVLLPLVGLPAALALLVVYTLAIATAARRGLNISCHCGPSDERVGRHAVTRNVALAGLVVALWYERFSLFGIAADLLLASSVLAATLALTAALAVAVRRILASMTWTAR